MPNSIHWEFYYVIGLLTFCHAVPPFKKNRFNTTEYSEIVKWAIRAARFTRLSNEHPKKGFPMRITRLAKYGATPPKITGAKPTGVVIEDGAISSAGRHRLVVVGLTANPLN
jgi:hypothetical protein